MDASYTSFILFLSLLWFLIFWVLGGVFFGLMTLLQLGRIRKLRFSCLFTLLAGACAFLAAYFGVGSVDRTVTKCLQASSSRAEMIASVFGCGFTGIIGFFFIGSAIVFVGGFIIMLLSKNRSKPWISIEDQMFELPTVPMQEEEAGGFFEDDSGETPKENP